MKNLRRFLSVLIVLTAPFALLGAGPAVVTLSGAVSDTFSGGEHDGLATFDAQQNRTALSIIFGRKAGANSQGVVTLVLSYPGAIRNGSFSLPGENTSGLASYHESSPLHIWLADESHGGSLALNITGTEPVMSGSNKARYLHGDATATMPAVTSSGASGTVQLRATF